MGDRTLERISFRGPETDDPGQAETRRLHLDRYAFAARHIPSGARVLDLACGVGYGSALLRESGAGSVVGVDISVEAIEEANEAYRRDGIEFALCDYRAFDPGWRPSGAALPLALEGDFDAIVSLETIEHVPDPDHFIATLITRLRPGGLFIGSVPITPSMDGNPHHLTDFSSASFRRLLRRHGLTAIVATMRQRQPFNPLTVRQRTNEARGGEVRSNLAGFYLRHPSKAWLRLASTALHGFANLYEVVAARRQA
jgi:2-polyprenyl-3-methyl-5-hydroxy-6-metoxy-1,4-benzoquinol methylase